MMGNIIVSVSISHLSILLPALICIITVMSKFYLDIVYVDYPIICLYLTLKAPSKIAADDTSIIFYFYLSKKIRLDILGESSASRGFT